MDIQEKIIKVTIITAIIGLLVYSVFHFIIEGKDVEAVQIWCSQVAISICTSALVTGMVAYVSGKQIKRNYFHSLGKEFSRLFNCVDDYLSILELDDLYFDEYYSFRNDFLSFVLTPEKDSISLKRKEEKVFREAVTELYLKPSNLLYYSYIKVKKIEKAYLQEKGNQSYKVRMHYKKILDKELLELNTYLLDLKQKNKYNVTAAVFYKMAGADKMDNMSMDDCESAYKDKFYEEANLQKD